MGSIYREQWEAEAQKEIDFLLEKRVKYGWTESDTDRYHLLLKELDKS